MGGEVRVDISGSVATVVLSHPGRFNAMSRAMWRELQRVFIALQQNSGLRAVLLRGEAGHFCAGGDISEYAGFRFEEASLRTFHEDEVWGGLKAVLDCDLPVVAQIEGNCMGAGLEIASCCDIRIAGESARFGAPIARLGFPMAPREAALVIRATGELTARAMLLEAAIFSAADMHQRGFLSRVAADADMSVQAADSLQRIATLAPQAARMNKQVLRRLADNAAAAVPNAFAYADSAEHREGIAAFTEKRPPRFGA